MRRGVGMKQSQEIIPRLRRLAELENAQRQLKKDSAASASLAAEIESVRAVLPTSILSHHDARRERGKVSIAPVVRGICRACNLAIPRGRLAELRQVVDEVNVCDNCGVLIYLEDEGLPVVADTPKRGAAGKKKAPGTKRMPRRTKTGEATASPRT
jgi:predicted  nucleic acid-binding Zn-ribbon protein